MRLIILVAEYINLDQKIQAIQGIIECLPIAHQYLLLYLLDMLGMFATAHEYTRMDIECLSAVFAPVSMNIMGFLLILMSRRAFYLILMMN